MARWRRITRLGWIDRIISRRRRLGRMLRLVKTINVPMGPVNLDIDIRYFPVPFATRPLPLARRRRITRLGIIIVGFFGFDGIISGIRRLGRNFRPARTSPFPMRLDSYGDIRRFPIPV